MAAAVPFIQQLLSGPWAIDCRCLIWPSSGLQAFLQLTHCLVIPVADIPHVSRGVPGLDAGGRRGHIQCRHIEREERTARYRRVASRFISRIVRALTIRYCYRPAGRRRRRRSSGFFDPMRLRDFIDFISVERESTIGVRVVNTLLTTTHCL